MTPGSELREALIQVAYLAASLLFILGLRGLSDPQRARGGMRLAMIAMLLAVVGTLLHHDIVRYDWILAGLLVGSLVGVVIGLPLGIDVPMTAMPQFVAISHMFGAVAATLVGIDEYRALGGQPAAPVMVALGFEVVLGALTVTGSFVAFAKLQELIGGRPITFPGQHLLNVGLLGASIALVGYQLVAPGAVEAFYLAIALASVLGVLMVLPIGGADMPVVISLLNAYAGLAASAMGFALGNNLLIVVGALDGASGLLLSLLMCKAMNRSIRNVLFGGFGSAGPAAVKGADQVVREVSIEDAAVRLAYAQRVIVVPGYGLAVARAQHLVREMADLIEAKGGEVRYAIHPVAGRMPGHMNVLLAESEVPYDRLFDMDEINAEFERTDVALVIGANDVVNPAARTDPSSPIYGMPILDVDRAKSVVVLKRGMGAGFAGIENELFLHPKTSMLFGDAKSSLTQLVVELKTL
ncbi:MAG: NAD(P)(+) transhydrogenase (Re/Si-specific) subunit beta [Gemmatimonadales bacterium]|nr:NAD(P)(+) transhydrogenase (Re/Si-specific) subunit beta [Gemmatimonadales bacterium]